MSSSPAPGHRFRLRSFLLLAGSGIAISFLSINIPGTIVHFDFRWVAGFLGIILLRHWSEGLLLFVILSASGPHQIPFHSALIGNLCSALPILAVAWPLQRRFLRQIQAPLLYGLSWFGLVLIIYQIFFTPLIWAYLAYLRDLPYLPTILKGWSEQPFLLESFFVGLITTLSAALIRLYNDLRESRREIRDTLYSIGDGVIATDAAGRIKRINPAGAELTGWSETQARGHPLDEVFDIINEESGKPVETPVRRVLAEGKVVGLANHTILRSRDGVERPILDSGAPIFGNNNEIVGVVLVFRDQTNERNSERQIKNALADREILLRELYHRTKNNMNVIQSMLALRASGTLAPEVKQLVADTESRIQTISLIHEKLYQTANLSTIDLGQYVAELSHLLVESYGPTDGAVGVEVDVEIVSGTIDTAVPCGLLVNEVVANVLQHAFPEAQKGRIFVSLKRSGAERLELSVRDNGIGVPPDFDYRNSAGFGFQMIAVLVEHQLQGSLRIAGEGGLTVVANFPYSVYARRV